MVENTRVLNLQVTIITKDDEYNPNAIENVKINLARATKAALGLDDVVVVDAKEFVRDVDREGE